MILLGYCQSVCAGSAEFVVEDSTDAVFFMRFSYVGVFLLGGVAMRTSAFRATFSPLRYYFSSYYVRISDAAKAAMPGSRSIAKLHHLYYLIYLHKKDVDLG